MTDILPIFFTQQTTMSGGFLKRYMFENVVLNMLKMAQQRL